MGTMSPSKMPKAKKITRKDDPNEVTMYAKGGEVKKYADGDSVKESFDRLGKANIRPRPKAEPKKEAPMKRLPPSTEDIVGNKPLVTERGYAKGGESKVNEAGNYTKPGMRKSLFSSIKSGGKGGAPGQWSARKAQMLALQYKSKGGGYK